MKIRSIDQRACNRKSKSPRKRQPNALLAFRRMVFLLAAACLLGLVTMPTAIAVVTVTGDVSPTPPAAGGVFTPGNFRVGNTTIGTMSITDGTSLNNTSNAQSLLGDSASGIGVVTVDGLGSEWLMRPNGAGSTLTIGDAGQGQLQVLNGARVRSRVVIIADDAGAFGTVSVDGFGSLWENTGNLEVGDAGNGALEITGGGFVNNFDGTIADLGGSFGTVTVDGFGSLWENRSALRVGDAGTGVLEISNSASVTSSFGSIGTASTGTGRISVDGLGTTWTNESTATGLQVGDSGNGTLEITNGGSVTTTATGLSAIGNAAGSIGRVVVDGFASSLNLQENFRVGNSGSGVLEISDGGSVVVGSGSANTIGEANTGSGQVTVTGQGSLFAVDDELEIADQGQAVLNVLNGGRTRAVNSVVGNVAGSSGNVLVDGLGSTWELTRVGTSTALPSVRIGNSGLGEVTLANSGLLFAQAPIVVGTLGRLNLQGGRVAADDPIDNSGVIEGDGRIETTITNNASGQIRTVVGDQLVVTGGATSAGLLSMNGGEIEFDGAVTSTGQITTRDAVLRFDGGFTNESGGQLTTLQGNNDLFGSITNEMGGQIAVTGDSFTTFANNVINEGQFVVQTDATANFLQDLVLDDNGSSADSNLNLQLGGTINVLGQATLDGVLDLDVGAEFDPEEGEQFLIVSANGGFGGTQFTSIVAPTLDPSLDFEIEYDQTTVTLRISRISQADFNLSGAVNATDLDIWQAGFGVGTSNEEGDADNDGDVDGADFLSWQREFGVGSSPPQSSVAAVTVPEPSTFFIVVVGCLAWLLPHTSRLAKSVSIPTACVCLSSGKESSMGKT